ncbi:MAG: hypothetical protein QMB65_09175 [Vicingaceae bacterium]
MKKTTLIFVAMLATLLTFSQAPERINYQAVARNNAGVPLVNTSVNLIFEIIQTSTAVVVYKETQSDITNNFGLFTSEIGSGTVVTGSFSAISWGLSAHTLRITINGDVMQATQLLSVPYALYAKESLSGPQGLAGINCWDTNNNSFQDLSEDINGDGVWNSLDCVGDSGFAGTAGVNGLSVNWNAIQPATPILNDAYYDSVLGQSLIWDGTTWQQMTQDGITPTFFAGPGVSIVGNTISATDTSVINEIQSLSINGTNDTIFLTNGGFVPLPANNALWNTNAQGIDYTGANVGIGTSTPGAKLDVVGTVKITDGTEGVGKVLTSNAVGTATWQSPSITVSPWTQLGGSLSPTAITSQVGIGTIPDPNSRLSILSSSTLNYGINNQMDYTGASISYGIYNLSSQSGTGDKHGLTNEMTLSTGANELKGIVNRIDHGGSGVIYGVDNLIIGTNGTGQQVGTRNVLQNNGTGFKQGTLNRVSSTTGASSIYGTRNDVTHDGTGSAFGFSATLSGASTDKTGIWINGEDKNFFSNKVGIGIQSPTQLLHLFNGTLRIDDGSNPYNLPPSGGTAGDILTMNGGNAVWQAPATLTGGWNLSGNMGTTATDFIGTTDAQDLDIRTNNTLRHRFTQKGQLEFLNTGNSVFLGEDAGENDNLVGSNSVFIGYKSGFTNISSQWNVGIGYSTLQNNTSGGSNTAIGSLALRSNTTGASNTAVGLEALQANTTGGSNTAIGYRALYSFNGSNYNTAIGSGALQANVNGSENTALGGLALNNNTNGTHNVGLGMQALNFNTTGSQNVAIGYLSLWKNILGNNNTAIGISSLQDNTGSNNTALGNSALELNTTGVNNLAAGSISLRNNIDGGNNAAFGFSSLSSNTSGDFNVAVGVGAGQSNITGSNNTFIGKSADASVNNLTNASAIGADAQVDVSNALILGNNANVGIGTSAPAAKLDVIGTVKITDGTQGVGKVLTADAAGNASWQLPVAGLVSPWVKTGVNIHQTVLTDNVGIGVSSSLAAKLDVAGNAKLASGQLYLGPVGGVDNGYTGIYEDVGDLKLAVFYPGNTTNFGGNSYDALTVKSNTGLIGIGTSAPTATLDVRGSLFFPNAGTPGANKILTSDAAGNATWQTASGGNGIYSGSGSLTGDRIVTQAANRVAFNSTVNSGFNIVNNAAGNLAFTIENMTDGTPIFTAGSIGARIAVSAGGTQTVTGVESRVTGTTSGLKIAGIFSAEGTGAGWNRGLNVTAKNSTATNLALDVTSNSNTGINYGMRVNMGGTGTGTKYGIRVIAAGTTAGSTYGLYLQNNGTGTKYGVYSFGENRNYFSGDVGIGTNVPSTKLHINGGHLRHEGNQPTGTVAGSSDMRGAVNVNFAATGTITVVFDGVFTVVPIVIITPVCNADPSANARYWLSNVSTTGFTVNWSNTNSTPSINYMVIE